MKLGKDQTNKAEPNQTLQEMQKILACFDDEVLPHLPSQQDVLSRAKRRRLERKLAQGALLVVLATSGLLYLYNPSYQQQSFSTAMGEQIKIRLSDGSQIHLNSNSQLKVLQKLRSREMLLLQGEASFEVKHVAHPMLGMFERTFVVRAGDLYIRDIGTVFNVRKISQSHAKVVVQQGEVAVSLASDKHPPVHLNQGHGLASNAGQLYEMASGEQHAALAWQSGKVLFHQTPLRQAIVELQRYQDFEVLFDQPQTQNIKVYGQFNSNNYQEFMKILPHVAAVDVEQNQQGQWLIKAKANSQPVADGQL